MNIIKFQGDITPDIAKSFKESIAIDTEATGLQSSSQSCEVLRRLVQGSQSKTSSAGARAALSRVLRAPSVPNPWFPGTITSLIRIKQGSLNLFVASEYVGDYHSLVPSTTEPCDGSDDGHGRRS